MHAPSFLPSNPIFRRVAKSAFRGLLLGGVLAGVGKAQTLSVTASSPHYAATGGAVTLNVAFSYATPPAALALRVMPPAGWTYANTAGTNVPQVTPVAGEVPSAGQGLSWAFTTIPATGARFSIVLNQPAGQTGTQTIAVEGQWRDATGTLQILSVTPVALTPIPSVVRAVVAGNAITGTGLVAVELGAQGNESGVGFTLEWDPAVLRFDGHTRGTAVQGSAAYAVNTTQEGAGKLGMAAALPEGTFAAGNREIVVVTFTVLAASASTELRFTDSITVRSLADSVGTNLPATFTSATIAATLAPPPTITAHPVNQLATVGGSATFMVGAGGSGPFTYQWRRNGLPIAAATGTSLTLSNLRQSDTGFYDVAVSSSGSSVAYSNPARLGVAPAAYPTNLELDAAYDMPPEVDWGWVKVVAPSAGGKILVGGDILRVNGTRMRRLFRLNADGSLDTAFTPSFGGHTFKTALEQPDGKILAGGQFYAVNGAATSLLARLNADGTSDPGFAASVSGQLVDTLAVQTDGRILVGGAFSAINGTTRINLARLAANGALDTTFATAVNGEVQAIAVQSDGRILIGGSFNIVSSTSRGCIARLNTDGTVDPTFNPGTGFNGSVNALAVDASGTVFAGGMFTTCNGVTTNRIARLDATGAIDAAFAAAAGAGFNGAVQSIALASGGKLVVGGNFVSYDNATNSAGLVRIDAVTAVRDAGFAPNVPGEVHSLFVQPADGAVVFGGTFASVGGAPTRVGRVNGTTGARDAALTLALRWGGSVGFAHHVAGGKILVAGEFTHWGAQDVPDNLVRLNADLTPDASFNPGGSGPNGWVGALAVRGDNRIVLGGYFTAYNGTTANRVARLTADGALDISFQPGVGPNNGVLAVAVAGDRTFIGGRFTSYAGASVPAGLLALRGDGTRDTSFEAGPTAIALGTAGHSENWTGLTALADGRLLVGGSFTTINGVNRTNLARLNVDGSVDASFAPPVPNGAVRSTHLLPDGRVLVLGDFTSLGGTAASRIARLSANGAHDTTFTSTANGLVFALAPQEDGRALVFDGPLPHRLLPTGASDSSLAYSGFSGWSSGSYNAMLVLDDGSLVIGNSVTGYGQQERFGLVHFKAPAIPPPAISAFSPAAIAPGLSVTITGTNLTGATVVKFGGVNAASFTVDSATQITAVVPAGITTGAISVTTPGGTGASSANYTLTSGPIVSAISPTSGPPGRVITVSGVNFGVINSLGNPQVSFNGTAAPGQRQSVAGGFRVAVPPAATTGPITVTVSGGGSTASPTFTVLTSGTPPANDDFANAQLLSGASGTVTGQNVFATKETGEPSHGTAGGRSVWYRWVAPTTGAFVFDQAGSEFGAFLGVYTGSAVGALARHATGDPLGNYFLFNFGAAAFAAQAGETYYIAVDGYQAICGELRLTWSPLAAPTIASFTPTTGYVGTSVTVTGTGFTREAVVTVAGVPASAFPNSTTSLTISALPSITSPGPIVITTVAGSVTSATQFTVPETPVGGGRALINLSTRAIVGGATATVDAPFRVEGDVPKTMLIRALGPALAAFGLAGVLADPVLSVYDATGAMVATNDNWSDPLVATTAAQVGAFALASGSLDAALVVTLPPGTFTAVVSGKGGASGAVLAEIYDADTGTSRVPYLANRQRLDSASEVAIAGFVISGSAAQRVLIRGVGTGANPLANPLLRVFRNSSEVASNDNWGSASACPAIVAAGATAGLAPMADGSTDAALLLDLSPGAYTAQLFGTGGGGTALIEVTQIDAQRAASFVPALLGPMPAGQTVVAGGSVTLRAPAFVAKPAVSAFEWLRNDALVAGASGPVLTLNEVQPSQSGEYRLRLINAAGTTTTVATTVTVLAAGADAFAARTVLAGSVATSVAVTGGATKEAGEPNHAGNAGGKSVWWTWTAPGTGQVTIDTLGSDFDTVLAVYTGTTLAGLVPVNADDNGAFSGGASKLTFNAVAGTTYQIAVDGVGGAGGNAMLQLGYAYVFANFAGEPGYGDVDGIGSAARFNNPSAVAVGPTGDFFVCDTTNHTIRRITPAGLVTTFAGRPGPAGFADGLADLARFNLPRGIAADASGNLYVVDQGNFVIRKITPAGVVSTFAGSPGLTGSTNATGNSARFSFSAVGIAVDGSGNLYVADAGNHLIRKITPDRVVSTLAGSAGTSGSTDGTGAAARFNWPAGIAVDGSGTVYVADLINRTIRKINSSGVVTTLAGTPGVRGTVDGVGPAAQFDLPYGVVVDAGGSLLYVADTFNRTLRRITADGVVTTLAGLADVDGSADGTGGAARFNLPHGLALDANGVLLVADTSNHAVRRVTPEGVVTTLAGTPSVSGSVGSPGTELEFAL